MLDECLRKYSAPIACRICETAESRARCLASAMDSHGREIPTKQSPGILVTHSGIFTEHFAPRFMVTAGSGGGGTGLSTAGLSKNSLSNRLSASPYKRLSMDHTSRRSFSSNSSAFSLASSSFSRMALSTNFCAASTLALA